MRRSDTIASFTPDVLSFWGRKICPRTMQSVRTKPYVGLPFRTSVLLKHSHQFFSAYLIGHLPLASSICRRITLSAVIRVIEWFAPGLLYPSETGVLKLRYCRKKVMSPCNWAGLCDAQILRLLYDSISTALATVIVLVSFFTQRAWSTTVTLSLTVMLFAVRFSCPNWTVTQSNASKEPIISGHIGVWLTY